MRMCTQGILILLLFTSNSLFAQFSVRQVNQFQYPLNEYAPSFSCDSLLAVLEQEHLSTNNCYYVKPDHFLTLLAMLHNPDKLYVFNNERHFLEIVPENSCASPLLILKNSDLTSFSVNKTITVDSVLKYCSSCSVSQLQDSVPTIMIFWNLTIGIPDGRSPFAWEQAVSERWGDQVNIIKINTDVNKSWPEAEQKKYLSFYQTFVDKLKSKIIDQ